MSVSEILLHDRMITPCTQNIFLTYGIEFVLVLAVLENSVLPMG